MVYAILGAYVLYGALILYGLYFAGTLLSKFLKDGDE